MLGVLPVPQGFEQSVSESVTCALTALHRSYARADSIQELVQSVVAIIVHEFRAAYGFLVLLRDTENSAISVTASVHLSAQAHDAIASLIQSAVNPPSGDKVRILSESMRNRLSKLQLGADGDNSKSCLVPIFHGSTLLGALLIGIGEDRDLESTFNSEVSALVQEIVRLARRSSFFQWSISQGYNLRLVGMSARLIQLEHLVRQFGRSSCPVLISGETGSGKEIIARYLHFSSGRRQKPFITVNCGAFTSDDLLASELFGHVRGAFTGAHTSTQGKFELADGGTLFLDEVSCMSSAMQVLLLRVLRYGDLQKVGDDANGRRVDVRLVAACNEDLASLVGQNRFRRDLYSRLRVGDIAVPPLRDRREDIPLLLDYFLHRLAKEEKRIAKSVTPDVTSCLMRCPWPDNIAGLENAIRYAHALSDDVIGLNDLPNEIANMPSGEPGSEIPGFADEESGFIGPLSVALRSFERVYILRALKATNWNVSSAARLIGVSRQGLQKKLQRFQILRDKYNEQSNSNQAT